LAVRGIIAAADASNANALRTFGSDINRTPIPQMTEAGKHFRIRTRIEPREVFVITLDEERRPWLLDGVAPVTDLIP
jgi:hypothetical protein